MPKGFSKYVVEFHVHDSWLKDGFDLTDERAKDMLNHDLAFAHGTELRAKVIEAPTAEHVAKQQGYAGEDLPTGIRRVEKVRREGRLRA